jgi:HlyD family secretion protein
MTSAVNVIVNEQKNVMLIPNRAVRLISGDRVVYVLVNNQSKSIKIQIGATDGTNSVLVSGDLKEGDLIILNPPSGGPFGG